MSTFGPGDYGGYNDWAFSGANTFWTNWNTSTFATGTIGRVNAIGVRWDGYSGFCTGSSGHNDLWSTGNSLVVNTGNYGVSSVGGGTSETMHNVSCADTWQNNASYYIGFWRVAAKCSIFAWKDGVNGDWAGKSADDGTNSGGSHWASGDGGLPVFGTVAPGTVYVRRGAAWTPILAYVRRGSGWTNVRVELRRSGSWNVIDWLQQGHSIPPEGMPVEVNLGEHWEPGWLVEEGNTSWFGNVDPDTSDFSWRGKYNSFEPDEVAEQRLQAHYEWHQALRWERYEEAKKWYVKYQPPIKLEAEELAASMACGC